jgi:hypothetical protein
VGLVTLDLVMFTYIEPNTLLHWLSFVPQLETLSTSLSSNRDVEGQPIHPPIMTPVTLPNLHHFTFQGLSTYLEAIVHRITTPRLEKLGIDSFDPITGFFPHLLQFMNTTEGPRFDSAKFVLLRQAVRMKFYPLDEAKMYALSIHMFIGQVSFMAQVLNASSQMFYAIEHLTLEYDSHSWSYKEHNEVDRTEWRQLLGSFRNVKTLRVDEWLVDELSRCLGLDDGEIPLDILPELQELIYSGNGNTTGDPFISFVDARQSAGRPVTLVRRNPTSASVIL